MNIKDILNNVLAQSGFLEKDSYLGSTDPDDRQMIAIGNRVVSEIQNFWSWAELRADFLIDIIEGQTRYVLPNDFLAMIPNSCWELDGNRQCEYPVPDRRWFVYKFTNWSDGGTLRIRKYGNELEVHDPDSTDGFQFEYISKYSIVSAGGERKEFFTVDTDEYLLDDQLLVLGIQAHWMQTKLMPQYTEHFANYRAKMNEAIGRSFGAKTIGGLGRGMVGRGAPYYPLYRPS
jgi:hypothetical protein